MYISVQRQFQNWTKISSRTEKRKSPLSLSIANQQYHDSKKSTASSSSSSITNTSKTKTAAAASERRAAPGIIIARENEEIAAVRAHSVRAIALAAAMVDGTTCLEQQQHYDFFSFGRKGFQSVSVGGESQQSIQNVLEQCPQCRARLGQVFGALH
jgi:hypothetical protein